MHKHKNYGKDNQCQHREIRIFIVNNGDIWVKILSKSLKACICFKETADKSLKDIHHQDWQMTGESPQIYSTSHCMDLVRYFFPWGVHHLISVQVKWHPKNWGKCLKKQQNVDEKHKICLLLNDAYLIQKTLALHDINSAFQLNPNKKDSLSHYYTPILFHQQVQNKKLIEITCQWQPPKI